MSARIKGEEGLCFSSNYGGPFIVTHLATQDVKNARDIFLPMASIAELPRPLYVRGEKSQTYISSHELENLKWFNAAGTRTVPPKPDEPVVALYYKLDNVAVSQHGG